MKLPHRQKLKQYHQAIFGPLSGYIALTTGDEAAFWASPAPCSFMRTIRAWRTGPAWWYVTRAFALRLGISYLCFALEFATILSAIVLLAWLIWR